MTTLFNVRGTKSAGANAKLQKPKFHLCVAADRRGRSARALLEKPSSVKDSTCAQDFLVFTTASVHEQRRRQPWWHLHGPHLANHGHCIFVLEYGPLHFSRFQLARYIVLRAEKQYSFHWNDCGGRCMLRTSDYSMTTLHAISTAVLKYWRDEIRWMESLVSYGTCYHGMPDIGSSLREYLHKDSTRLRQYRHLCEECFHEYISKLP
jgi:hypothetical protein